DLVLADFGASDSADETVYLSHRIGTIAYDSPKSLGTGKGNRKPDYWSLGITLAELALGHHPFADPAPGERLRDEAIKDHLWSRRPVPLDGIGDERARDLCRGLTR